MGTLKFYAIRLQPGKEGALIRVIKENFLCGDKPVTVDKRRKSRKGLDRFMEIVDKVKVKKEPVCLVDEIITDFRGYVVVGVSDTKKAITLSRSLPLKHRLLFGVLGEKDLAQLRNREIEDFFDIGDTASPKVGPMKGEVVKVVSLNRSRGRVKVQAVDAVVPVSFELDITDLTLIRAERS